MKSASKILYPLGILIFLASCENAKKYPDVPFLEYRSAEFISDPDTLSNRKDLAYTLYFTDGDGDLGSDDEPNPNIEPCDNSINNLYINYFEKINGKYEQVLPIDDCLPFDSQIPVLDNGGSNPTLKGVINGRFDYSGFPFYAGVDSVKLEFQVEDEAGNKSNIAVSRAIAPPPP